eukprot:SAG11_NODE_2308_length_3545_cov_2.767557_3_plen_158_part_00
MDCRSSSILTIAGSWSSHPSTSCGASTTAAAAVAATTAAALGPEFSAEPLSTGKRRCEADGTRRRAAIHSASHSIATHSGTSVPPAPELAWPAVAVAVIDSLRPQASSAACSLVQERATRCVGWKLRHCVAPVCLSHGGSTSSLAPAIGTFLRAATS